MIRFENIGFTMHPVSGYAEFDAAFKNLEKIDKLTFVFLVNCGGKVDLVERLGELEATHPKLKVVLLDAHRPLHHRNLGAPKKVIIVNDETLRGAKGKLPTVEEIEFLEKYESEPEDGPSREGPSKEGPSREGPAPEGEGQAEKKDAKEGLFDREDEDVGEQIGKKRLRRKKAERAAQAKRFEELCGFKSRQNHALLQRGLHGPADVADDVPADAAAGEGGLQGAVAVDPGDLGGVPGVQGGQGRVHVPNFGGEKRGQKTGGGGQGQRGRLHRQKEQVQHDRAGESVGSPDWTCTC